MADENLYTLLTDLHPRPIRVPGAVSYPNVSSITVAGWPNSIAASPEEAIGKCIIVEEGKSQATFFIESVEGDKLNLRREQAAHDPA